MEQYDPDRDLAADDWLDLDEQERMMLVEDYHRRQRIRLPNVVAHAVVHAIVENQLALVEPVVVTTFARPRGEGLDRHDAIHAIGSVLSDYLDSLLRDPYTQDQPNESYHEALGKLAASEWRAG
jgi:hypothetical protein